MPNSLKLLSCNLWNGRARPWALAELIERLQPDLVLAQELSPDQADVIARALPHGQLDPRTDTRGMGVAARHPMEMEVLPLPRRSARVASLDPAHWPQLSEPVEVVNVHISAPTKPGGFAQRRTQIERLERHIGVNGARRVVAGDFNSFPGMSVYNRMRAMMRDVVEEYAGAQGREPVPTWSPTAWAPRLIRIDHVMTTGLSARVASVERIAGSDHSALWAELTLD